MTRRLLALLIAAHTAALPAVTRSTQGQAAATANASASRDARVDSLFARYNTGTSPGLALTVVRDGKVVLRRGYGLADLEHRLPITPATVFDVASVSKQFTGLAVAMLVTQGKVKRSDDIRKYIPELPDFGHTITIDHLLHHTSGIRDWPGTLSVGGWRFDDVISFRQILTMAYNQRSLNFVPGAEYLYSNTGYNLLAELVQRVTGQSFRAFTDETLLRPLGMNDSHFHDDHTELTPNRAYGYTRQPDGSFRNMPNALTALGSSSLFSSADDLARWVINFGEERVGGAAAMALWRTPGVLNDGKPNPYAFGIQHGAFRGVPTLSHTGSWASFSTYVVYMPQQKLGVVVLANSGAINAQDAGARTAAIFLERELARVAAVESPRATGVVPAVSIDVPAATLDEYAGLYRLGPGWYTRIARAGASLTSTATREDAAPMTARSAEEFWLQNYGASMTFKRDASGKVSHLEYRGNRAPRVATGSAATPPAVAQFAGEYESEELTTVYRAVVANGSLSLQHARHGTIPLEWFAGDEFGSATWFLKGVEFTRSAAGLVTGFIVNGDARSRNIVFRRR